jgi:hypothetical protein
MAQESGSQNQNSGGVGGFFQKNQIWLIVAAIVILAGGYYLVTRNDDQGTTNTGDQGQQSDGQTQPGNTDSNTNQNGNTNGAQTGDQGQNSGNVTATGTLRASDNAARGNLMIEGSSGKIYVATKRDFSSLLDKPVTLQAEGTLNSFKFLGFAESNVSAPAPDQGGTNEGSDVAVTGTLRASDNLDRGNYLVDSASGKIYLQTARDYSAWLNQQVELNASGTLDSFTGASLIKK